MAKVFRTWKELIRVRFPYGNIVKGRGREGTEGGYGFPYWKTDKNVCEDILQWLPFPALPDMKYRYGFRRGRKY